MKPFFRLPARLAAAARLTAAALDAARAVEEAALALDLEVSGRRAATSRLSAEVAAAIAREDSLDRRVAGLHRALDGLRAMGLGAAEDLLERLFPAGLGTVIGPSGRAQVPEYQRLADALHDARDEAGAAHFAGLLPALRDDLRAYCAATLDKDEAHREGAARASGAAEAAAALKQALTHLDRVVELEAGGPTAALYQRWALVVRGIS